MCVKTYFARKIVCGCGYVGEPNMCWDSDLDEYVSTCECGKPVTEAFSIKARSKNGWLYWVVSDVNYHVQKDAIWKRYWTKFGKRFPNYRNQGITGKKAISASLKSGDKVARSWYSVTKRRLAILDDVSNPMEAAGHQIKRQGQPIFVSKEVQEAINRGPVALFDKMHSQQTVQDQDYYKRWYPDRYFDLKDMKFHLKKKARLAVRAWAKKGGDIKALKEALQITDRDGLPSEEDIERASYFAHDMADFTGHADGTEDDELDPIEEIAEYHLGILSSDDGVMSVGVEEDERIISIPVPA